MKDLAIINSLESGIWTAKRAFTAAVVENLKEIGKVLTIVGDGDNEELGYPEGLLMSMQNKHGIMVDCVYDLIKMDGDKVMLHQSYWDDGEDDYWQHSEDIGTDDLLTIYSAIDWEDFIPKGESEDKPKQIDKRLELTDDQLVIINRYNNAVKDLADAGVECVFYPFEEIGALNAKGVDEVCFEEDAYPDEGDLIVPFESLTKIACPFGLNLTSVDSNICVRLRNK